VLIVHGLGDNLESYTNVGDSFRRRGHDVLLVDLRSHGGSEGRGTTLGDHEREDVRAGMARLRRDGLARHGIVVLGYSLGATSSLLAVVGQEDVRALIAESPSDTLRETLAHHSELLYHLPRWLPIGRIAIFFAEVWGGFDADRVDAIEAARQLHMPLMLLAGGADPRMPEAVVRRIYDAHPGPKEVWVVPGADHVGARLDADYDRRLDAFLKRNGL
jgi:pimeloyl-ACP methyl ester carboxylesterase